MLLDTEDRGSTFLQNVGDCLPVDTVLHYRSPEFSSATPSEPQITRPGAGVAFRADAAFRKMYGATLAEFY